LYQSPGEARLTTLVRYVTIGYMRPDDLKRARRRLGLTQEALARKLRTTRMSITRYESGTRRIPGVVEVVLAQLTSTSSIPLVGIVAAGLPIEPIPQLEAEDVPPAITRKREHFGLRIKGESMRDEGILPGDIVIVLKQHTARAGQTIVALINGEATIKKYVPKPHHIELHPANEAMRPIVVRPEDTFEIQGIVTGVIRYCE
jgi:repressor LexA